MFYVLGEFELRIHPRRQAPRFSPKTFDKNESESYLQETQEIDVSRFYSIKLTTSTGKQFDISFTNEGNGIRIREVNSFSSKLVVHQEADNSIIIK